MHILDKIDFPPMLRVRQKFNPTRLRDVEGAILDQIRDLGPQLPISPGQSVALACPSRGLADYPLIVKSVVAGLKQLQLKSFIIPFTYLHRPFDDSCKQIYRTTIDAITHALYNFIAASKYIGS